MDSRLNIRGLFSFIKKKNNFYNNGPVMQKMTKSVKDAVFLVSFFFFLREGDVFKKKKSIKRCIESKNG